MDRHEVDAYRDLKNAGVEVSDTNQIQFNAGSETIPHFVGKALVGYVAQLNGFRVSSEVETEHGEIDVLLYGNTDRLTYAVEVENNPRQEVVGSKLERYVHRHPPVDDLIMINAGEIPLDMIQAANYVAEQLGLEL